MKIAIITLGCKVNQYESDSLKLSLEKLGHKVVSDFEYADVYIVNTCAVTNEAERKSRQTIGKCKKLNPNARIIVSGCASERNAKQFSDLDNVTYVTGVKNKLNIIDNLQTCGVNIIKLDNSYDEGYFPAPSTTRAYVKIQDGCNNFCSYCIIPYLRGRSRSRNIVEILNEVSELSKTAKEIVLTGIDISDYKIDGVRSIAFLIKSLQSDKYRIRLGSIENSLIGEEFIEVAKEVNNLCPHFHMSLQSGCDKVLKKMNRHYTTDEFYKNVKILRKLFKNPAITTDIIVGFPGESETDFEETMKFVKKVKFANIHVFPYSNRAGTVASRMPQLEKVIKTNRAERLQTLANKLHQRYIKKSKKDKHELLIETIDGGYAWGYTENYIRCKIKNNGFNPNDIIKVKITSHCDGIAEVKQIRAQ